MDILSCDVWAVEPSALSMLRWAIDSPLMQLQRLAHERAAQPTRTIARPVAASHRKPGIGIIPVHGMIEARPTARGASLGMTSYEWVGKALDQLMADPNVGTVVFDYFTPGGMVYGAPEAAAKIFSYRGRKPMISIINHMAASGGYWLAAAADRVVMTPSGDTGGIGIIEIHVDESKQLKKEGRDITVIRSTGSPYKNEMNGAEPLTPEGRRHMQSRVDRTYDQFAKDLARFRGVTVDHVNQRFGKGRLMNAQASLRAGMIDHIGTADETLAKLMAGRIRIGSERACDQWNGLSEQEQRRVRVKALAAASGTNRIKGLLRD